MSKERDWWNEQVEFEVKPLPPNKVLLSRKPEHCKAAGIVGAFDYDYEAIRYAYILHLEGEVDALACKESSLKISMDVSDLQKKMIEGLVERATKAETERDELRAKLEEVVSHMMLMSKQSSGDQDFAPCPPGECLSWNSDLEHSTAVCEKHIREWLKLDAHGVGSDGGGV